MQHLTHTPTFLHTAHLFGAGVPCVSADSKFTPPIIFA